MCAKYFYEGSGGATFGGSAGVAMNVQAMASGGAGSSGSAIMNVQRHWAKLLETSEQLYLAGYFGVAIIVAQTACEVIFARAIETADPAKRTARDIRAQHKLTSFSPDNKQARRLYNRLRADNLPSKQFWGNYKIMLDLRHESVHVGTDPTQEQARKGIDAVKKLVAHVEKHNGLQG